MELAPLFVEYLPALKEKYGKRLLPSHHRAIQAILTCRTPEAGAMIVKCPECGITETKLNSCGHRNCPKCQNHEASVWLDRQMQKLLPIPYFFVTFTIPATLRSVAWFHQRIFYSAMFEASKIALQTLAKEERFLGGEIGFTGVLHTHSRPLNFHPHLHFLVPAGAIDIKNRFWKRKDWHFLFPENALAEIFRETLLTQLKEAGITLPDVEKKWVVNCKEVGSGAPALKYLSQYLYRGIIAEKRIIANQNGKVTFVYRESETRKWCKRTLSGEDFLWLLLRHVLPRGFRRARDFGFLHGNAKKTLMLIQLLMHAKVPLRVAPSRPSFQCPKCNTAMKVIGRQPGAYFTRAPP